MISSNTVIYSYSREPGSPNKIGSLKLNGSNKTEIYNNYCKSYAFELWIGEWMLVLQLLNRLSIYYGYVMYILWLHIVVVIIVYIYKVYLYK